MLAPKLLCRVHDAVNDQVEEWQHQRAIIHRKYGVRSGKGVVAVHGLPLNGWTPMAGQSHEASGHA